MNVVECLKDMRHRIEEEGWIQGEFHIEGLGYCLEGAMRYACGLDNDESDYTPFLDTYGVVDKTLKVNGYNRGSHQLE